MWAVLKPVKIDSLQVKVDIENSIGDIRPKIKEEIRKMGKQLADHAAAIQVSSTNKLLVGYSIPPNTGQSGIQMVIFRTVFLSGYQTVRFSDARDQIICPDFKW